MPSLLAVATAIAVLNSGGSIERGAPANGGLRYNQLTYSVRAIQEGGGLGGQTPYCAAADEDLLMIVYSVTNNSDADISGPAVPRLALTSPEGNPHKPNPRYSQALANKVAPPLIMSRGVVPARGSVLLADVFVTPRAPGGSKPILAAIIYGGWRLHTDRPGTQSINLPQPGNAEVLECPRSRSLTALRPGESR